MCEIENSRCAERCTECGAVRSRIWHFFDLSHIYQDMPRKCQIFMIYFFARAVDTINFLFKNLFLWVFMVIDHDHTLIFRSEPYFQFSKFIFLQNSNLENEKFNFKFKHKNNNYARRSCPRTLFFCYDLFFLLLIIHFLVKVGNYKGLLPIFF